MAELLMPSLGADMDDGTLLEWKIRPGDRVERGDIVAVVDTDKAAIEIEIFESGVVRELLVTEGEKVPVGTPLAHVGEGVAIAAAPSAEPPVATPAPQPAATTGAVPNSGVRTPALPSPESPSADGAERPHATPAARKRALERDVDLTAVEGTGRHGVITKADIERAAAEAAAPPPIAPMPPPPSAPVIAGRRQVSPLARRMAAEAGLDLDAVEGTGPQGTVTRRDIERAAADATPPTTTPSPTGPEGSPTPTRKADDREARYAAMRRAIAAAMSRSKREIPHYYLSTSIDMLPALTWLEEGNLQRPIQERILPAALLLRATALAARDVPALNGFWREDAFQPSERVHLGVGISLRQGGLIAPAILDADRKDLATLMADLRDLVKRARRMQLRSSEMTDATMTTTNLGDQGVDSVYGIVYPPQVALVGFGKILRQPWADGDLLGVRPVLKLTLAADHRASDGHVGGLFLNAIVRHLQNPEES
jgi:pyruvate dehydrogenase E2 component (dihydrolipoamide acetyltransferase)